MPPTRFFLDWDRPLLPQAAARLLDHYTSGRVADLRGVTAVLPGARARRRLVELLLEEAEDRGLTLIPPDSVTVGGLPDRLLDAPRPPAEPSTARRAWSHALRATDPEALRPVFPRLPGPGDLAGWDALADLLAGLHETVAREGHRFADVARMCGTEPGFDDGARWEVLAGVRERYLARLDEAGLVDRHELRIAALEAGVPPHDGDIWLISVVDLPSATRRLVEGSGARTFAAVHAPSAGPTDVDDESGTDGAAAFDAYGVPTTEYWSEAELPVTDEVLRVVDRPVDQADAVVSALHALGGRYAAEDVVVSVHAETDVVPFLEQRLEARGVHPRYAGGTPLTRAAPLRLLEAVAAYVEDHTYAALAALLRHPDAGPLVEAGPEARTRLEAVDIADRFFGDHLPHRIADGLPRAHGKAARFAAVAGALSRSGPLARLGGRRRLSRWMPDVLELLRVAYETRPLDRARSADRQLLDVLTRVRSAAAALGALPEGLDDPCTAAVAIRALLVELRGEALPPEARRDALELVDWLEVALDDAPVVVITGCNEGFLPESTVGHPFLPDGLRGRLGLVDNRRRAARDAYRLTTVLHSKETARIVAGRRSSTGDPLRPSRLLFRIRDEDVPGRVLAFFRDPGDVSTRPSLASVGLEPADRSRFQVPPEPVLELSPDEVPSSLSVTAFGAVLADPYRFVLERIMKLEAVDDDAREMDPLAFGTLAHEVLQRFGTTALTSPSEVDLADADSVRTLLFELLDTLVDERFGRAALPAVALQAGQLRARFAAFAETQAAWAADGWRIAAVEQQPEGEGVPFDVDGAPFLLRGRIDRIDHHPATDRWTVLDYKTGNAVETPDRAHRKGRGSGRRWVDLQLPLYRRLLSGVVDSDGARLVSTEAVRDGRVSLGYVALPRETAETAFLLAEWDEEELAEAEEVARQVVRVLRSGRFTFDATVTKPRRYGSDALEPLLTRGWQAPESDADDPGSDGEDGDSR